MQPGNRVSPHSRGLGSAQILIFPRVGAVLPQPGFLCHLPGGEKSGLDEPDWSNLAPFVAIPTTAGTGSEVGRSSVITLESTHRKSVLFHPELLAKLVILDPELTVGLPPRLTAATGADALTHCIESYTCPQFQPMCDGIALEGIRLIAEPLPRAVRNGADLDARGRMLVAAAMGAVAFQKDLGLVHSMAHPLSTLCGLHHGLANSLCLAAGMRFCAERKPGLYRRVGLACGLDVLDLPDPQASRPSVSSNASSPAWAWPIGSEPAGSKPITSTRSSARPSRIRATKPMPSL